MRAVFADTFYFLALCNRDDEAHERAATAAGSVGDQLVTTDWVLTELADALADPESRRECVLFIQDLYRNPHVRVVPASRRLLQAGLQLYGARPDKSWSLTDCISFVVMQEQGLRQALTGDHHFEQAGFSALFASRPGP